MPDNIDPVYLVHLRAMSDEQFALEIDTVLARAREVLEESGRVIEEMERARTARSVVRESADGSIVVRG